MQVVQYIRHSDKEHVHADRKEWPPYLVLFYQRRLQPTQPPHCLRWRLRRHVPL